MWKEINGVKPAKISSGEHIEILLVVACASVQKINVRVFVALAHDTFTLKTVSSCYAGLSMPPILYDTDQFYIQLERDILKTDDSICVLDKRLAMWWTKR